MTAFRTHLRLVLPALLALTPPAPAADADVLPEGALLRLGTNRLRVGGTVQALALSGDGRAVAVSSMETGTRVWDTRTGKLLAAFETPQTYARVLRFSPDGKRLAGAAINGLVYLWDVPAAKPLARASERLYSGQALAWSADGKSLAVGSQDSVLRVLDGETLQTRVSLSSVGYNVLALNFQAANRLQAVTADGQLRHYDLDTRKQSRAKSLLRPGTYWSARTPGNVAFQPDGKRVSFLSSNGGVEIVNADGTAVKTLAAGKPGYFGGAALSLALSSDGRFLAAATPTSGSAVWGTASGKQLRTIPGPLNTTGRVCLSDDAKLMAVAYLGTLQLIDLSAGKALHASDEPQTAVRAVTFLGNDLATLHADGTLAAWDGKAGKLIARSADRCHPDGGLASVKGDKAVRVFTSQTAWLDWAPKGAVERGTLTGYALFPLSPDGTHYLGHDQRGILVAREFDTGREVAALPNRQTAGALQFSPDGRRVTLRNQSYQLAVTDLSTGTQLAPVQDPYAGQYAHYLSPGGRLIAYVVALDLRVYEAVSGSLRVRHTLTSKEAVVGGTFTPDGRAVVIGLSGGSLVAVDLDTGKELARREKAHKGAVRVFRFSPDGTRLATGSDDTTLLVWDVAKLLPAPEKPERVAREAHEKLWADLASDDHKRVQAAVRGLGDSGEEAVALLREKLAPRAVGGPDRIAKLIVQLDERRYRARENATRELAELGPDAESALKAALEGSPSPEVKKRVESLLKRLQTGLPAAGRLRETRAAEVLQRIGPKQARALAADLAKGPAESHLTREAQALLASWPSE